MAKTVTHIEDNEIMFGEETLLSAAQDKSFPQMIFELLSENSPNPEQLRVFELILNLSIDHGEEAPSASATIAQAQVGSSIGEAVAAGISQINHTHGGAIEPAMINFYLAKERGSHKMVAKLLASGQKIAGFGHRLHKDLDPRAQLILNTMKNLRMGEEFIKIAEELHFEVNSQTGKKLPLNIDGAIAVALCSFGWKPGLGQTVFIIARTPGLCGHYLNNSTFTY